MPAEVHPERQLVTVVVRVVLVAAVLDHQTSRVRTVATGIPAHRPQAPGEFKNALRGHANVLTLHRFRHLLIGYPAPAMAGDFVAGFDQCPCEFRMALQRHRHTKHRQGQTTPPELPEQSPDPYT